MCSLCFRCAPRAPCASSVLHLYSRCAPCAPSVLPLRFLCAPSVVCSLCSLCSARCTPTARCLVLNPKVINHRQRHGEHFPHPACTDHLGVQDAPCDIERWRGKVKWCPTAGASCQDLRMQGRVAPSMAGWHIRLHARAVAQARVGSSCKPACRTQQPIRRAK